MSRACYRAGRLGTCRYPNKTQAQDDGRKELLRGRDQGSKGEKLETERQAVSGYRQAGTRLDNEVEYCGSRPRIPALKVPCESSYCLPYVSHLHVI